MGVVGDLDSLLNVGEVGVSGGTSSLVGPSSITLFSAATALSLAFTAAVEFDLARDIPELSGPIVLAASGFILGLHLLFAGMSPKYFSAAAFTLEKGTEPTKLSTISSVA